MMLEAQLKVVRETDEALLAIATGDIPLHEKVLFLFKSKDPKRTHCTIEIGFDDIQDAHDRRPKDWEVTILLKAFLQFGQQYTLKAGLEEQLVGWARGEGFKAYVDWPREKVVIMNQYQQFADYTETVLIRISNDEP